MAESGVKLEQVSLTEVSYEDEEEVALMAAAVAPATDDDDPAEEGDLVLSTGSGAKTEAQVNGVMVLTLLDKIIGVVDQIQQTQNGLEARQQDMEKSVLGIQGELTKLSKSHTTTANTVNKMLDKVRKVSVNVKTVRTNLEKQAGQIKRLETNENELLKRRNFKVLIYQEESKLAKVSKAFKSSEKDVEVETAEGDLEKITEEEGEKVHTGLSSDEEVEIEEIIEESRAERIKRSSKQRVDNIKKAFSKEKMEKTKIKTKENLEKTKQRTRENLEKTRQRTKENLEKTKHNLEKKIGKLGTRMTPNQERKDKLNSSKEKLKKSLTPDHTTYARSKTAVYRVPPFTFHVKKIRDGEEEVVHSTEMVEVSETGGLPKEDALEEDGLGYHVEVEQDEGELESVDSQDMAALLEVAEDSQLVMVESDHRLKKRGSE
ncbi:caveolae-associated protein 1 [Aplochiton taeniatus]